MDFREYATKETTSAVSRLLASQSDAALHHLRSLRDALDAATHAVESASSTTSQADTEIQELIRRLNTAAASAMRAAAQRVQDEARALIDAAHAEAETERARNEQLENSVAELQAHVDDLLREWHDQKDRAEVAERDLVAARETQEQIEAARTEAEAECRQLLDAKSAADDELRETRGLLDAALSEAAHLTTQLEAELAERATLNESLRGAHERQEQLEAARDAAEAAASNGADARAALEHQLVEANRSLDHAIAEASRVTIELEASDGERSSLLAEVSALHDELGAVRSDREALSVQVDALTLQVEGMTAQIDAGRARIGMLERGHADQEEIIRNLENSLETASQAGARLRDQLTNDGGALAEARATSATLLAANERLTSVLDAALRAADELANATTVSTLLTSLVIQLATQFSRVALFRLKGNRLEGEHQIGFDLKTDVTKIVVPLNMDSLLTRAVTSGVVESLTEDDGTENRLAPFGAASGHAIAIPVVMQKDTLAVVYAEESNTPSETSVAVHEASVRFAKLLVRQTVAFLARLTQELKALTELRDYAALLVQEAEQMYLADIEAGKVAEERRRRLKDTIECARQLYTQRAAMEGPAAAALLEEHMTTLIDAKANSPFAQDVAAVIGYAAATTSDSRRAAEAS